MIELQRRSGRDARPAAADLVVQADGRVDACASLGRAGGPVRVRLRRDASDGIRRPALNVRRGTLRRGRQLTLAAVCLVASLAARAQLGATVAVESDYRFRGVSLDESGPSLRASFNYDAPNGCYGGASATRVELEHGDRYAQVLGYAGCATPIDVDRQVEAGATFSHFTGDSRYDFAEVYVGLLAGRWGARLHFAPDYFGRNVSTVYAEFDAHTVLDENFRAVRPSRRDHEDQRRRRRRRAARAATCASAPAGSGAASTCSSRGSAPPMAGRTRRSMAAVAAPGSPARRTRSDPAAGVAMKPPRAEPSFTVGPTTRRRR